MNITELGTKSDFIASKRQQLQMQWKHYLNTLIQGITLSKTPLHLTMEHSAENALRFTLFEYYALEIRLARGFHTQTVQYTFEQENGEVVMLGEAMLTGEGLINDRIHVRDRQNVLEHYLELIAPVYDMLYRATQPDAPVERLAVDVENCRNASNLVMG
ncbi:transcriptional regulator [Scandinavium sp.]|uniref:transcriptional regulator n=1 Tax=Scandinavium sp. TaxID=2830653 RepID=UPI002899B86B|nr:transcriptional regulator [Scandinavium sp.]